MTRIPVLLVSLIFAGHSIAQVTQTLAPIRAPQQLAQAPAGGAGAGGAAAGASLPPAIAGPASNAPGWVAFAAAVIAAASVSYSTPAHP